MDWITREQVLDAARKGERAAIEMSVKHWEQILTAITDDYRPFHAVPNLLGSSYCALCEYIRLNNRGLNCEKCALGKIEQCNGRGGWNSSPTTWEKASNAFEDYLTGAICLATLRDKAQPMLDLLKSL